jgi:hypothetical protein
MQSAKISFDFSDNPQLVSLLRVQASRTGVSQKQIVAQALEAYFSHQAESALLLDAASRAFAEWDNPDDEIYNDL